MYYSRKATVLSTGHLNPHNIHYWTPVNPHRMQTVDQQSRWSLNVWCVIFKGKILGPRFYNGTLPRFQYANFIGNRLPVLLEEFPFKDHQQMW